ncbi:YggS family pyridoxal phosphate-dependent enzyme [Stenotrophomonas sp. S48]|uniref:YggS family pyridoxal phosphate-dependent enzyme n=1 Tax=unclassified Stenotrophomonas TaxID=196198 RepID=UPI001902402F|nr:MULTISPECIES: YggS family pyridoxal phosphate-dependent enzyme [unclassified Stenotrophomonas]MBK0025261.1 YggS family pyridoxal phosphate-dependent enzyme [Stenotrophomonas sp. S48]MBK0048773.1 YggS family pyridoxal phosphate-dependent enzyme [Stenotrophomonas sp. S49]
MPTPLPEILSNLHNAAEAAGRPPPRLLAVSKTQPAQAVAALAAQGQQSFGENYVQEALAKMQALQDLRLEWHLIGHLQSNKAEAVAAHFDWVQSVDRAKLVTALARHRPAGRDPLNVLIQVNIDDEGSKHGCSPQQVDALAQAIAAEPSLRLRGLMAIPAPWPDAARRREAFVRMRTLFETLAAGHPHVDTLSMGMSGDYAEAIAEGATLVRIGTALFGARPRPA